MNTAIARFLCSSLILFPAQFLPAAEALPSDSEIKAMLQERVDQLGKGVCVVAGIVDERGSRIVSAGLLDKGRTNEAAGETVFEIGSVTKVFTTLLLQDMIERGEMKLDDP